MAKHDKLKKLTNIFKHAKTKQMTFQLTLEKQPDSFNTCKKIQCFELTHTSLKFQQETNLNSPVIIRLTVFTRDMQN